MQIDLVDIDDDNLAAVEALVLSTRQLDFVGTVREALDDAASIPEARPWYRAVVVDGTIVGFVMLSWNVEPDPPEIIGPWFLWKLMVDERHQGRGIGAAVVGAVADIVRAEGATELLTSYVPEPDGPAGFYARLGFVPTGDVDSEGETIVSLALGRDVALGRCANKSCQIREKLTVGEGGLTARFRGGFPAR